MKKTHRVVITTGDIDGIGLEVTVKALARMKPKKGIQFFLWRSPRVFKKDLMILERSFSRQICSDWNQAVKISEKHCGDYRKLIEIESPLPPPLWVEISSQMAKDKIVSALVNAPLSKTEIIRAGLRDLGHTGILQRVTGCEDIFMAFLGRKFNVVLLTGHLSIRSAYNRIDQNLLEKCILLTHNFKNFLDSDKRTKPIGLVAVNPHAGEQGLIDNKEEEVFKPVLEKMENLSVFSENPENEKTGGKRNLKKNKNKKIKITSPLVGDVCFKKKIWENYSFYIASYHDQGLIPFKMAHQKSPGIQFSLGLPFPRTSVDHGTAKDLFGKNKARCESMEQAIRIAVAKLQQKPIKW